MLCDSFLGEFESLKIMSMNHQSPELEKERTPREANAGGFHLGYRRNLDGLRGIAILMVLLAHTDVLGGSFGLMGVQIFFVLSGFLITSLLVQEWSRTGDISLRAFYWRRALRLLPALYVMLSILLIYGAIFHTRAEFLQDWKDARAAIFYYSNWVLAFNPELMKYLANTWTLSIEEQFYIIWPVLLLFMLRRCSRETVLNLTLLGIFLAWFTRFLMIAATTASPMRILRGSDTHTDAFLLGAVIGILLSSGPLPRWPWIRTALSWGALISTIGLAGMGWVCNPLQESVIIFGWFLMCLFASVIMLQLMFAPGILSRLALENPLIVYVGKVSYGLYLWHSPIIIILRDYFPFDWKCKSLAVLLSALATVCSYYLVERPFLRFKKQFQIAN